MKTLGQAAVLAAFALAGAGCSSIPLIKRNVPIVTLPDPCEDRTVDVYFERNSSALTREARAMLRSVAAGAKGCVVGQVEVVGLSEAAGAPEANLAISRKRAETVTGALAKEGFRNVDFKVVAAGRAGAINAEGEAEPLRRKVELIFHLTNPPAPAPKS